MIRIRGGLAACAAAHLLLAACGEEVPRTPPEEPDTAFSGHACDLVASSELSQIFVSQLEPQREVPPGESTCTWRSVDSKRPVFRYEIRPYMEDLRSGVSRLADDQDAAPVIEIRQGLGEAAVWTNLGLFVSRSGRTLQVTPFDEDVPRALYEELASLLLERLESGSH